MLEITTSTRRLRWRPAAVSLLATGLASPKPWLADAGRHHHEPSTADPDVTLELLNSRNHFSLVRREADVAVRLSDTVPDWLVGRQLAPLDFKIYGLASDGQAPKVQSVAELLTQKRWISFERESRDLKFDRWLDEHVPDAAVTMRVDGFDHALAMVRAGLGIALLPSFLEHQNPELQALSPKIAELRTPLWLITHKELRHIMRIKVLMQSLGPAMAKAVQGLA